MMTKTTHTTIVVRCDVGLCDRRGAGPVYSTKGGQDSGLLLAELEAAGWLLGHLDVCPSCKEKLEARRREPMEESDGA